MRDSLPNGIIRELKYSHPGTGPLTGPASRRSGIIDADHPAAACEKAQLNGPSCRGNRRVRYEVCSWGHGSRRMGDRDRGRYDGKTHVPTGGITDEFTTKRTGRTVRCRCRCPRLWWPVACWGTGRSTPPTDRTEPSPTRSRPSDTECPPASRRPRRHRDQLRTSARPSARPTAKVVARERRLCRRGGQPVHRPVVVGECGNVLAAQRAAKEGTANGQIVASGCAKSNDPF